MRQPLNKCEHVQLCPFYSAKTFTVFTVSHTHLARFNLMHFLGGAVNIGVAAHRMVCTHESVRVLTAVPFVPH